MPDGKRSFKDGNGKWFATYHVGDAQWHLKIRRGPRDWEHRRVPPQIQSDADARKYVKRWWILLIWKPSTKKLSPV